MDKNKPNRLHEENQPKDKPNDIEIPTFTRERKGSKKRGAMSLRRFKPIIIATTSAISIGLILGFVMLHLITNIGKEAKGKDEFASVHADSINNSENSALEVDMMQAFVLQVGVFSEQANAEKWQSNLLEAGFSASILEKEEQFFLLAGIASTEEEADKLALLIKDANFDVYVKEWLIEKREVNVKAEEVKWLQDFTRLWTETLSALESNEQLPKDEWDQLMQSTALASEDLPELMKQISSLCGAIKEGAEKGVIQKELIILWQQYERVIS